MNLATIRLSGWLTVALSLLLPSVGSAQNVVPATDGTGTRVQVRGDRHFIDGGQLSRDRTNLFHSFERFGLTRQQIATFQSNPQIRNILTRVVGGDASVIDGLLQVVGGNSNLFLLNPAGVIFGSHAQLDLPASFTATTANGIGFNQSWFSAVGTNDYASLVGDPNAFAFTMSQPGAIANLGNLQVAAGNNLTLLAGTVVNTGQLSAPQGNLTIASVPGSSLVRLSLAGQALSLEVEPEAGSTLSRLDPIAFEPIALPALLTGGGVTSATGVTVNRDGSVALTGSGIGIETGDVVVTGQASGLDQPPSIAAGNGTLTAAAGTLTLAESRIETAGDLTLTAADTVQVRDSRQRPFEAIAHDDLTLQGNQAVDIFALSHPNSGFFSGADLILRAPQTVSGDARYTAGGDFRIEQLDGSPGNLFSPYDPIIRAAGDVSFSSYTGASLHIIAGGSVTVSGAIAITGADPTNSINETILLSDGTAVVVNGSVQPTLDVRAGVSAEAIGTSLTPVGTPLPTDLVSTPTPASNADISIGSIQVLAPDGLVYLSTQYNPRSADASSNIAVGTGIVTTPTTGGNASSITIDSRGSFTAGGSLDATATDGAIDGAIDGTGTGGNITVLAQDNIDIQGDILTSSSGGSGGNVALNSQLGDLSLAGSVTTNGGSTLFSSPINAGNISIVAQQAVSLGNLAAIAGIGGQGGSVTVVSQEGAVQVQDIQASSTDGDGGEITVFALEDVITQALNTSVVGSGRGGNIILNSTNGAINTSAGALNSSGGRGGNVGVNATTNILSGSVTTDGSLTSANDGSPRSRAGRITFVSEGGIATGRLSAVAAQRGGAIALTANGDVTTADVVSNSSTGRGGNIALRSANGSVTTQRLRSQGNTGGRITVAAQDRITTEQINSSSSDGNGGDVTLDPTGNVEVSFINAQGSASGQGGTVAITTRRFFRATGQFTDQNGIPASISTAAGRGGAITITHAGAARGVPFRVGNVGANGTAAALTTGSSTISPPQSYRFSFIQGNIALLTGNATTSLIQDNLALDDQLDPDNSLDADSIVDSSFDDIATDVDTSGDFDADSYTQLEAKDTADYLDYLNIAAAELDPAKTLADAQQSLSAIEANTGIAPALLYVGFVPSSTSSTPQDSDQLELTLVTGKGQPMRRRILGATRSRVLTVANRLREEVTNPARVNTTSYLAASQQLYKWLIAPLEAELQTQKISNLAFIMDSGLRSLPIAALYNGHQFLIERYSIGLMPSLSLVDTRYQDIRSAQALAMGASQFANQASLPAVPLELQNIAQTWTRNGKYFIDQDFTLANLQTQRQQSAYSIVHLATHGEFLPGEPSNSYIQFWDERLQLDQLRQLGLNDPAVELLVLSACRTALGDKNAELGFAGLALQAGVKSALASLWYVSDAGTLALMAEFYHQLRTAPIKAEALRRAQLSMLRGEVQLQSGKLTSRGEEVVLPSDLADLSTTSLRHPYYWSAFTLIGSPW